MSRSALLTVTALLFNDCQGHSFSLKESRMGDCIGDEVQCYQVGLICCPFGQVSRKLTNLLYSLEDKEIPYHIWGDKNIWKYYG